MKTLTFLILLLLSSFHVSAKEELNSNEKLYWRFLRSKLFDGNAYVYRFKGDVKLQLYGNPSRDDSLFVVQLIDELNRLMETSKIILVKEGGNFVLNLDKPEKGASKQTFTSAYILTNGDIRKKTVEVKLDTTYTTQQRNKYIEYYLIRGLTNITGSKNINYIIEGAIFQESDPLKASFTDADKFIIQKIYSADFYDQLRKSFNGDSYAYFLFRYPDAGKALSYILFILIAGIMLFIYMRKGVFERNAYRFKEFFKQGVYVLLIPVFASFIPKAFKMTMFISLIMSSETKHEFFKNVIEFSFEFFIIGFIIITLMFVIENRFFRSASEKNKLVVVFFSSVIIPLLGGVAFIWILQYWDLTEMIRWFGFILVFSVIRTAYRFIGYRTRQEIRRKDLELANLEKLKQQAELQALHSRINPHFLYNSLNSIAALAHNDADKTEQMALSLSDFCRTAINKQNKDTTAVQDEVDMVKNYLEIEKVRLGDRLSYEINIDEGLNEVEIPRFLLQPLVENAVKHGISQITEEGIVRIEIKRKYDKLLLIVYDNGPEFPKELISGYGLQSLFDKLEILYNGDAKIVWNNTPEKFILLELPLDMPEWDKTYKDE